MYLVIALPASYYVYANLIIYKEFLFPTSRELGSAVWLGIAAYLYHTFNKVRFSEVKTKERKANYLDHRYNFYKDEYG